MLLSSLSASFSPYPASLCWRRLHSPSSSPKFWLLPGYPASPDPRRITVSAAAVTRSPTAFVPTLPVMVAVEPRAVRSPPLWRCGPHPESTCGGFGIRVITLTLANGLRRHMGDLFRPLGDLTTPSLAPVRYATSDSLASTPSGVSLHQNR